MCGGVCVGNGHGLGLCVLDVRCGGFEGGRGVWYGLVCGMCGAGGGGEWVCDECGTGQGFYLYGIWLRSFFGAVVTSPEAIRALKPQP
jgi:hypothetical protein